MCADPPRSIWSHSYISVIRHRPVKARAKLGARLVMSPRSASAVDQIACGRRKGQRPIADEVNKLGRFDAEIHMRTCVGSRGTDGSNPLPSSGESATNRSDADGLEIIRGLNRPNRRGQDILIPRW